MTRTELIGELLKLSAEERLEAAEELWESVVDDPESPFALSAEQIKEVERRAEELGRDPSSGIPWETVRARLLAKFG
ncbi:MAG TPA: addiction module protein [Rhizomicrobium sp.]|jgi:putative addiction module component (TIGR02574 family)